LKRFCLLAAIAFLVAACAGSIEPGADSDDGSTLTTDSANESVGATTGGTDSTGAPAGVGDGTPGSAPTLFAGVDISRFEVPLDEIIFDTFDGGSVALTEATEAQVQALLNAIPPIVNPTYETDPTWLTDDDLVLTMVDADGQAWAWPHRILNFHEIVSDEIDGVPIVITYCPLCRSGVIYDRRVDVDGTATALSFDNTSALYQNDFVMVDRETSSYWWQIRGQAIVGALSGAELTVLPASTARWSTWKAAHPDTLVLTRESGGGRYDNDPFASYAELVDEGRFPFPVSEQFANDDRLDSSALVIVVTVDDTTYAVPTRGRARVVDVAGVTIRIDGADGAAAVASDGSAYPSRSAFWFSAVSAFPDIELLP